MGEKAAPGATVGLVGSGGTIGTSYTYQPFGATTVNDANSNPYQFTGRENDGTGLHFYRARYYNPTFQRFVAQDPIGFAGGFNAYAYANDSPISFIDPLGLDYLYFDGTTVWWFNDAGTVIEGMYPADSGPWGRGRLPNGDYTGSDLRQRTNPAMSCPSGPGYSLNLDRNFDTDRTLLRMHPDGGVPATTGCIGMICSGAQQFYNDLNNYLKNGNSSIPLTVNYQSAKRSYPSFLDSLPHRNDLLRAKRRELRY
jgi:RHS repeat-associated protein